MSSEGMPRERLIADASTAPGDGPSAGETPLWRSPLVWLPLGVALLFALRALWLLDAGSLWGDELSTARKSFQPSLPYLLGYLRSDTHPPLYYLLVWLYGQVVPNTPPFLRAFSWAAYVLGGLVMTAQVGALAVGLPPQRRRLAIGIALLLAFCSPFPVRFSIEAKAYALLVLLVALALAGRWRWLRSGRRSALVLYGAGLAAAALTHYYGLFYGVALVATDWLASRRQGPAGQGRRLALVAVAALSALPTLGWIWLSRRFLFESGSAGDWIGPPDFALLEDTLRLALGPLPLPKLGLALLAAWLVWFRRRRRLSRPPQGRGPVPLDRPPLDRAVWLDGSGLLAGLVLVVLVVGVSFLKPLAFSRYFIVLLPAVVASASVALAAVVPVGGGRNQRPAAAVLVLAGLLLALFWVESFLPLDPPGALRGSRETNDFRRLVLLTQEQPARFAPRAHHLRTAERLLVNQGLADPAASPWRDMDDLERRLRDGTAPSRLVLAETSGPRSVDRRIRPARRLVRAHGYGCLQQLPEAPHVRLYVCAAQPSGPDPAQSPAESSADQGPRP